jgi:hypothetical protein
MDQKHELARELFYFEHALPTKSCNETDSGWTNLSPQGILKYEMMAEGLLEKHIISPSINQIIWETECDPNQAGVLDMAHIAAKTEQEEFLFTILGKDLKKEAGDVFKFKGSLKYLLFLANEALKGGSEIFNLQIFQNGNPLLLSTDKTLYLLAPITEDEDSPNIDKNTRLLNWLKQDLAFKEAADLFQVALKRLHTFFEHK